MSLADVKHQGRALAGFHCYQVYAQIIVSKILLGFELFSELPQRGEIKAFGKPGQLLDKPGIGAWLVAQPVGQFEQIIDITKIQGSDDLLCGFVAALGR